MNDRVLRGYQRLPPLLRSSVATARGYYLRSWRYGFDTDRRVAKALARETWTAAEWSRYQSERLDMVLRRAAERVPFYRDYWAERRRNGERVEIDDLQNWPILEKETVRRTPRAFLADDCRSQLMFQEHTSGTTGKPLDLWSSRETLKEWYALSDARWRRWYDVSRHDRWGMLGGQLVTAVDQQQPPFWVWNQALNQLYMSSYHLSPAYIPAYLDAITEYRLTFLLGYTSSIYALAQEALRLGRRDLKLRVVIANAEPVFAYQRQAIEQAFQCPLRETYGMSEMVAAASECDGGRLHLWPEVGVVEVLDGATPAPSGTTGDLVCTGLLNLDMPLIRYRIGDRGSLDDAACHCGHGLPLTATIEGRADDVLHFRDGRRVGRLDPVFKASLPVREAQIIQHDIDTIRIRYVPDPEFSDAAAASMIERLQDRVGKVHVILEPLTAIPRTANGKFRAVICELNDDQRAEAARHHAGARQSSS